MKVDQQKDLVARLITVTIEEINADFDSGKIPESWDGVELRWLIANKFASVVLKGIGSSYRKRKFNNHCLVEGV